MKSATLVTTLTSLTTAMAVVAPLVVFGFLYVLQVQPERAREVEARSELNAALSELQHRRAAVKARAAEGNAEAVDELVARASRGESADDLADALTDLLNSPAVGGVSNLIVETGTAGRDRARMTLAFDARSEQIVRFFRSLRALPPTVEVQAADIRSNALTLTGSTHAKISLVVGQPRDAAEPASRPAPAAPRLPVASQRSGNVEPIVSSILISDGRRVARVDGRIVAPGDRVMAGVVEAIEPDAVVVNGPDGRSRRVKIARPEIGQGTR